MIDFRGFEITFDLSKIKVVFLDLDDTLFDTRDGVFASYTKAFQDCGLAKPEQTVLDSFIGPPFGENIKGWINQNPPSEETMLYFTGNLPEDKRAARYLEIAKWHFRYHQDGTNGDVAKSKVFEGMLDLIRMIRSTDSEEGGKVLCCIATARPEQSARALLIDMELAHELDGIYGAGLDGKRNSKADVIVYALNDLGITDPKLAVLIDDAVKSVKEAKSVGVKTIGVNWREKDTTGDLLNAGAIEAVRSPRALIRFLNPKYACG